MTLIEEALSKTTDTKSLIIGPGTAMRVPQMFKELFPGSKAIVVADANTWKVAGSAVENALEGAGIITLAPFVFEDPDLYAEWGWLCQLEDYLKGVDAIAVAVGSGVINDLTKLSSHHLGRRYMTVGTAASMDGYTAFGASISKDGIKLTFECPAPLGIVIDSAVCAAAPKELSAAGYADLIAKVPAGVDWILSDALGTDPLHDLAWTLVQKPLRGAISCPDAVYEGDVPATEKLAEGLIMSGFAMQAMQSSRPASGIEHQFSHFWDMENLSIDGKHVSHGFKVGIGTLISTACIEFLLASDIENLDIEKCVSEWPEWADQEKYIRTILDGKPHHMERALQQSREKYLDKEAMRAHLQSLVNQWPVLKKEIASQIMSFDEVRDALIRVHAPYEPEQIHVSREHLRETFRAIPYMRSRYSNADIVLRCGFMNQVEQKLFGKGGVWECR